MDGPRRERLAKLLQQEYSQALYGGHGRVDLASVRLVYLGLLSPTSLRRLAAEVGLCALATGVTLPSDRDWNGCLAGDAMRCLEPCAREGDKAGVAHGLYVGRAISLEPSDVAWVRPALQLDPRTQSGRLGRTEPTVAGANMWLEVTHCPINAEPAIRRRMWLYPAPGSGISINIGRTAIVNELEAISPGWFANKWNLSYAMATLHKLPTNPHSALLDRYLQSRGLSAADVRSLTTLQRTNHLERTCAQRRHEVLLLRDDGFDEHVSLLDIVHRQSNAPSDAAGRIMCGRSPYLFDCTERSAAVMSMAPCVSGLSDGVRRHVGTCQDESSVPVPKLEMKPPETSCEKSTEFDTEHEACFSWCTNNPAVNCDRCKCRACSICKARIALPQSRLPAAPPPASLSPVMHADAIVDGVMGRVALALPLAMAGLLLLCLGAYGLVKRTHRHRAKQLDLANEKTTKETTMGTDSLHRAGTPWTRERAQAMVIRAMHACRLSRAVSIKLHQRLQADSIEERDGCEVEHMEHADGRIG